MRRKHRFETYRQNSSIRNFSVSVIGFSVVLAIFIAGVSNVSVRADAQAAKTLEQAINRGIVRCYTIENRFFVDYQVLGSNLIPEVTIIDRRDGS